MNRENCADLTTVDTGILLRKLAKAFGNNEPINILNIPKCSMSEDPLQQLLRNLENKLKAIKVKSKV